MIFSTINAMVRIGLNYGTIRMIILSREDCHLCDVVYRMAVRLQQSSHRNKEAIYRRRYGSVGTLWNEFPCPARRDRILLRNVTEGELRRAIKRARWRRPISRILSCLRFLPSEDDHFSGIRVTSNLKRPTRRPRPGQPVPTLRRKPTDVFLFGLASGDAYRAGDVTTTAVGSYPTVSPLPEPSDRIGIPSPWPSAV